MKLALYLPNLRDKITVSEIVDLAREAEALAFDMGIPAWHLIGG